MKIKRESNTKSYPEYIILLELTHISILRANNPQYVIQEDTITIFETIFKKDGGLKKENCDFLREHNANKYIFHKNTDSLKIIDDLNFNRTNDMSPIYSYHISIIERNNKE